MILKDIADDLGMHESTIGRVTTNKYIQTPHGIFELKYFFNSRIRRLEEDDIASEAVRNEIKTIIQAEDNQQPFSDQQIVKLLADKGIEIDQGTLYPLLRRLEEQGLLRSDWDMREGKPRKYYQRTELGTEVYARWQEEWKRFSLSFANLLEEPNEK